MNGEKIKKDIRSAINLASAIHDDVVTNFIEADIDSVIREQALVISSSLSTLVWYLEHICEGVL